MKEIALLGHILAESLYWVPARYPVPIEFPESLTPRRTLRKLMSFRERRVEALLRVRSIVRWTTSQLSLASLKNITIVGC